MTSARPSTWRDRPMAQGIPWPDMEAYEAVLEELQSKPPLVVPAELRALRAQLAEAAQGKAFLLQGGDCAEEFIRVRPDHIKDTLRVLLQMAVVLTYGSARPVIKVGRIAGQYAKPRSSLTEVINGVEMSSYRGDAVNRPEPTPEARRPDPNRLLNAYHKATQTLNLIRALTKTGFAAIDQVHAWNREFVKDSPVGESYAELERQIHAALGFMRACGVDTRSLPAFQQVDFYTSHEALILGYEDALVRQDEETGGWYACSGHLLWIGDRTRQLDGAHVEFFSKLDNPIAMKVGPTMKPDELNRLIEKLNPKNEYGRLTLITRFGADKIVRHMPRLVRAVTRAGQRVLWCCDPMHGNTFKSESGHKTRHFHHILAEIKRFFDVHRAEKTIPGGLHFELTGGDVTECLGGGQEIEDWNLAERYMTACDPRLNAQQALEVAFLVAEALKARDQR